jgi:hypothetical protein
MSKRKSHPPAAPTGQPGQCDAGREVRPDSLPPETAGEAAGGAMPLGLPIPFEQYKALQEQKHRKPPLRGIAQEDAGEAADN